MKIAIDLRPLQIGHQNRGIGAYLQNILTYFPADNSIEYIFLRYKDSDPVSEFGISNGRKYREIVYSRYKFQPNPKSALLFLWGLVIPIYIRLLPYRPDIFFQPDYLLGIPNKLYAKKTVVTCYDLIPLKFPAMYIPSWRKFVGMRHLRLRSRLRQSIRAYYYTKKYARGLRTYKRATAIISISNSTTSDLVKIAKVNKSKVHTIYLAPSYRDTEVSASTVPSKLKGTRYIFYIGGGDKRRQISNLISAFNKLNGRGHDIDLVLAGSEFGVDSNETSADVRMALNLSSYSGKIHLIGTVSESEKMALMKNAAVFAYPSLYEGFGLPVVEAMIMTTPVVTYRNSSIDEIGGDDVFYALESSDGLYETLLAVLNTDKNGLNSKLLEARKNALKFSWDKTGRDTWDLILKVSGV